MIHLRGFLAATRRRATAVRVTIRRRPRRAAAVGLLAALVALTGVAGLVLVSGPPPAATIASNGAPGFTVRGGWTLADLERHVESGDVDAITAAPATAADPDGQLLARTRSGQVVAIDLSVGAPEAVAALTSLGYGNLLTTEALQVAPTAAPASPATSALAIIVPLLLLAVLITVVMRMSRRAPSAGRDGGSKFMTIMPPDPNAPEQVASLDGTLQPVVRIALADVAGCDEAKFELTETIEFLKTPEKFRRLGARIPRGIMLYGPPGTGKTMLARAVAAEAGVPFHYASGSEFVEKYVGVGAKRIRDLFAQARKLGRGVIFFDEFDAIGKSRGGPNSHEEREQTLNQLLVELDGFGSTDDVIVIAATNRLDVLDSAVLRPGRFTRKIHVGMPDVKGRRAILEVHARNKPLAALIDLDETARKTYGFSGAMLADLLNEAAIMAARRGGDVLDPADIHGGWLKVAVGTSRRRSMDGRERSIIAAHEVGHAICGKVHGDKRRVEEISLFAHGDALGVTVSSQEDNDLPSESDLRARLIALMGGRAAEEILFHEVTGGAANDFEAANRIATSMVTKWGMGRDPEAADGGVSGRGALSFFVPAGGQSLPSEIQPAATRAIRAILDEAYADASRTLIANLDTLRRLAAYLVEHERVDGPTFDDLFDGRLAVPTEGDEWRAAGARPRAWGDVVDLAGHRSRTASRPVAVAATSTGGDAAVAEAVVAPDASITASELVDRGASVVVEADAVPNAGSAQPVVGAIVGEIALEPVRASALAAPVTAGGATVPSSAMDEPVPPTQRLRGRRSASRRARNLAAALLQKAERRLRGSELETDHL
jgi:cell division protease FtsH